MNFNNQIMLITYADGVGKNLKELDDVLEKHYQGAIGGVHILPFFPSSADRGFAPVRYDIVDPAFGDWKDIQRLSNRYYLMFDFMINHISRQSKYFKDFAEKKDASEYRDMFIRYKDFWPNGEPTEADVDLIYKRKPRAPYVEVPFADGTTEKVWCTFDDEQIDLNFKSDVTKRYVRETLRFLAGQGASIIRLDAFAYAAKKIGTNCFFVEPDIWEILSSVQKDMDQSGQMILPEIHEHYTIQLKLAEKGYWVYDFALPMLVLYTLYLGDTAPLKHWLKICPRKQFTTLDTHDGIGVVDVKDLLTDEQVEKTQNCLFEQGAHVKRVYNSELYHNMDIYQINCTYYSALGNDDDAYLLARALQFFAPGVPQVYYVGMLVGENDVELVEKTKQGRDINRHNYTVEEVDANMQRPVVKRLRSLMRFRNSCPAFNGQCVVADTDDHTIEIHRVSDGCEAVLHADLSDKRFVITYRDEQGNVETVDLD
ncbi:sucrose phosphorylase [Caproicibacterium amylolyticum]|uniref:Sucrose 6(F)-phosphate phosphorylase n=1 Tax=Caproicibacterium amylolyticum TaxID=2766537 RepID=A0A7G9WGK5_9FIRM|nr:sucrose phosphorylase [Caproicibacterium amylolyticum]QNO17817.1 sucrose phosphorylase [Caproicibacterium amylolyticum]